MPPVMTCPNDQRLRALFQGETPPDDVNAFADHLERCPRCAEAADQLLARDTVREALRSQATVDDRPGRPEVEALVGKLLQAPPFASAAAPPTLGTTDTF